MKFFIDTANLEHIQETLKKGFVSGVTTNPSLMSKEPKSDFIKHIKKIIEICQWYDDVPLSVEVFAEKPPEMYSQALEIYDALEYENLNIKIPVGYEELEVVNKLYQKNIDVNVTCCFTEAQLELSALAGARYVSLFYNRLLDFGGDPIKVLQNVRNNFDENKIKSEIIVGSIRKDRDVVDSWTAGGHIVTAGYNLFPDILQHPMTNYSVEGFLNDFKDWIM
tara:strand:- start:1706 stop:2371 length:666 start_codon:yes stop_codon:yes gene_type:complete